MKIRSVARRLVERLRPGDSGGSLLCSDWYWHGKLDPLSFRSPSVNFPLPSATTWTSPLAFSANCRIAEARIDRRVSGVRGEAMEPSAGTEFFPPDAVTLSMTRCLQRAIRHQFPHPAQLDPRFTDARGFHRRSAKRRAALIASP